MTFSEGIRKPCFSTNLSLVDINSMADLDSLHLSKVIQIDSVEMADVSNSVSQFVSLDDMGYIIFWMTSQANIGNRENGSIPLLLVLLLNLALL